MFNLDSIPPEVKKVLLRSHILSNTQKYRRSFLKKNMIEENKANIGFDLFSGGVSGVKENMQVITPTYTTSSLIWGTNNYANKGKGYKFSDKLNDLSIIVPRSVKSQEDQKRRVKEKAEVFTPSWICSLQNNLIDDEILYPGAFNTVDTETKTWKPNPKKVKFSKTYDWQDYVIERRLEACCGEAPYVVSPYDTVSGIDIPIRDENNAFQRIGLLDRKLRIVTENVTKEEWYDFAIIVLKTIFGYEWQGDNLILARLNVLNTFIDYFKDATGEKNELTLEQLLEVSEIISWNFWQMDGLKQVIPMSCSANCIACLDKYKAGHDGKIPLIRFFNGDGYNYLTIESMLPLEFFPKKI